jgi:hypothetical protein
MLPVACISYYCHGLKTDLLNNEVIKRFESNKWLTFIYKFAMFILIPLLQIPLVRAVVPETLIYVWGYMFTVSWSFFVAFKD